MLNKRILYFHDQFNCKLGNNHKYEDQILHIQNPQLNMGLLSHID
jgi:hypothetical protein